MQLPRPRGALSRSVTAALRRPPHATTLGGDGTADLDEDAQLTLFVLYALHYAGFDGVDDAWEWQPGLLALRAQLESRFEATLRARCGTPYDVEAADLPAALQAVVAADDAPSMAAHVHRRATLNEVRELLTVRSLYNLAEADPHTWALPRLSGQAKAGLLEIQADEYGGGRLARMHSSLFATTMTAVGLDPAYGAYLDDVPVATLAAHNAISMFGLHRRLRGAVLGHLAALEMTSSLPNRRYAEGLRRLGLDETAVAYFDEHIEADAVHEQIAVHDMCVPFAREHPELVGDVLLGAAVCLALDGDVTRHLLHAWAHGRSALVGGLPLSA